MENFVRKIRKYIARDNKLESDAHIFCDKKKILDVGCGKGLFLSRCGNRGIGIDGANDNVAYCQGVGLKVVEMSLPGRLPFEDQVFDGVYCSHFIEHFSPKDALLICQEINRVLQRGGYCL